MVDKKLKLEDIGSEFTQEGLQKLKKGQLLRFIQKDNTYVEFLITSLNLKSGKVFVKRTSTHHPDEVGVKDKYGYGEEKTFTEELL